MKKLLIFLLSISISANLFAQIPSSFDSRTLGYISSVKDQQNCGSCWAFASIAAIEAAYAKKYAVILDLSEDNLIDCHGFDEAPCAGGNFYMTQAMLSMHKGLYSETTDPYTPYTLDCINNITLPLTPIVYSEECQFLPANISTIKQAIMNYGAVASSMFMNYNDTVVWDSNTYRYFDSIISSADSAYAHCVTIVGWDNSFIFPGAPANGGWIIKDSYGTSWADSGYFYCSFYDAGLLSESIVFNDVRLPPNPIHIPQVYSYDELGWVDTYEIPNTNSSNAIAKFTFTPINGNASPQKLVRVGTYIAKPNTRVTIDIYKHFDGVTLSGYMGYNSSVQPVSIPGFYEFDTWCLCDTIGGEFYVVIEYHQDSSVAYIPIETYEAGHTTNNFQASANKCWIGYYSFGQHWQQCGAGTSLNFDPCIKVFAETSIKAFIDTNHPTQVCKGTLINFNTNTIGIPDSTEWYINPSNYKVYNQTNLQYVFNDTGTFEVLYFTYFGDHRCYDRRIITVSNIPDETVSSTLTTITSNQVGAQYQWLDCDNNYAIIQGAINQSYTPTIGGNYAVEIIYNACIDTSVCTNIYTSIGENEFNSLLEIYPNPANDFVIIKIDKMQKYVHLKLRNIIGQLIISEIYYDTDEILLNLPIDKGVYFLEIGNGQRKNFVRLIVK